MRTIVQRAQRHGRLLAYVLLCLCLFLPLGSRAASYEDPKSVPNPQLRDSTQFVTDVLGVFSDAQRQEVNSLLHQARLSRGVDVALVVLPSIGERVVEEYATELFRLWGLGDGDVDNGLLILYVEDQRVIRIEVGYGLEGILTDARVSRVQRQEMIPHFRNGQTSLGLMAGAQALVGYLDEAEWSGRSARAGAEQGLGLELSDYLLVFLFFAGLSALIYTIQFRTQAEGVRSSAQARARLGNLDGEYNQVQMLTLLFPPVGLWLYVYWRRRRQVIEALACHCPVCAQKQMCRLPEPEAQRLLTQQQELEVHLGSRTYQLHRCGHCAHTEVVAVDNPKSKYTVCPSCSARAVDSRILSEQKQADGYILQRVRRECLCCGWSEDEDIRRRDQRADALGTALILGSLLGGRSGSRGWGGGGFSGGSWGGGSSGGGGATGRW